MWYDPNMVGIILAIIAFLLVIWGVVNLVQGAILFGIILIVVGLVIGGLGARFGRGTTV